jgi:hypothetical protein
MTDNTNEPKKSTERNQEEHFQALKKINDDANRRIVYMRSVITQIMEAEFAKTAPKKGDRLDEKYNFSGQPKVMREQKETLTSGMLLSLLDKLQVKLKKLSELEAKNDPVNNAEIEKINKEIDASIAEYIKYAKNNVLQGGSYLNKDRLFKKEVNIKIKEVLKGYGQVLDQAPIIPPVVVSPAPEPKPIQPVQNPVAAQPAPTELDAKVNQLISEYKNKLAEMYKDKGVLKNILHSIRNPHKDKRTGQIRALEEALSRANNFMNSNAPDKASKALELIQQAAVKVSAEVKKEHPVFKSRLSAIANEISGKISEIQDPKAEKNVKNKK